MDDMREVRKAFKKFDVISIWSHQTGQHLTWWKNSSTKLPEPFLNGMSGRRVVRTFSPYEVKRVECTKPGFFRAGEFKMYGMDDHVLVSFSHKDKANCKAADLMNYYLELYRTYNLPK